MIGSYFGQDYFGDTETLAVAGALVGTGSATSGASGSLARSLALVGTGSATSGASGSLARSLALVGSASATGSGVGVLGAFALVGTTSAIASASGTISRVVHLVGTGSASGGGAGTMSEIAHVADGDATATSDAWGFLSLELPERITTTFDDRWSSGEHVGVAKPSLYVEIRRGRFNRRYARWNDAGFPIDATIGSESDPDQPWQAIWEPVEAYVELPNVLSVEKGKNFDQKGIETATITIENIVYLPETVGPDTYHTVNRGYLSPLRGYVADGRTPLLDERGDTVEANDWFQKLDRNAQVTVYEGYGDEMVKTFTGLIDDVDTTSRPGTIQLSLRSFGKVFSDEEFFGWNIDPNLRDPVTFIDRDEADNVAQGGTSPSASSEDSGFPADLVNDGDADTYWRSDAHGASTNTEWVEIRLAEGRYEDFVLGTKYAGMDAYISIYATQLASGDFPTRGGAFVDVNDWIDTGAGTVPGAFGGIPYLRLAPSIPADTAVRTIDDEIYELGPDSILRISFRNLHDIGGGAYHAGVRNLYSRKRTLVAEPGANQWVRVGDISDVIKVVCRWAGFQEWEIESAGARLGKRLIAGRQMKYMDLIDKVKDGLGYQFFLGDPTSADESIGVPIFRKSHVVATGVDPVITVTDADLLTAVELKETDENRAYIIRTRGRTSKTGDTLGGDTTRRIMYVYRPPWSGLDSAGIIRHVIHTNEKFKNITDLRFAAWYIALEEALASVSVVAQIPAYPGIDLDDIVVLEDLGTGISTRLCISERRSTSRAGETREWTMTFNGSITDTPDVQEILDLIQGAAPADG